MGGGEAGPGRGTAQPGGAWGDTEVGRRAVRPHRVSGCFCVPLRLSLTLWVCVCLPPHGSLTPHSRLTAAARLRTKAWTLQGGGRGKGTSETPPSGSASPVPGQSLSPGTGTGCALSLPLRGWQQTLAASPRLRGFGAAHGRPACSRRSRLNACPVRRAREAGGVLCLLSSSQPPTTPTGRLPPPPCAAHPPRPAQDWACSWLLLVSARLTLWDWGPAEA